MEGDYQVSLPGSLLGYVLFNVFLSDLKIMLNNEVIKYPHETNFFSNELISFENKCLKAESILLSIYNLGSIYLIVICQIIKDIESFLGNHYPLLFLRELGMTRTFKTNKRSTFPYSA